ncbi:hypothetical protein SKAU_G00108820 [Synaphobranchus kaupii]|uniref:Uncharacterized protein n=1 Tax=Synaphobranchus kaupii TaxID=118154 RepID=A0A9Q1FZQ5_SYNKA|nr:hypothetical protein SKAU_G00108820 [Synaphobranchus kaupii]
MGDQSKALRERGSHALCLWTRCERSALTSLRGHGSTPLALRQEAPTLSAAYVLPARPQLFPVETPAAAPHDDFLLLLLSLSPPSLGKQGRMDG